MVLRPSKYLAATLATVLSVLLLATQSPLRAQSKVVIDNHFEWENVYVEDREIELKLKVGDTTLFKKLDAKEQIRWAFDFLTDKNAALDRHVFYVYSLDDLSDESIVAFRDQMNNSDGLAAIVTMKDSKSDIGLGTPIKWTEEFANFLRKEGSISDSLAFEETIGKLLEPTSEGKIGKVVVFSTSYASKVPTSLVNTENFSQSDFEFQLAVDKKIEGLDNVQTMRMVSSAPAWPMFDE